MATLQGDLTEAVRAAVKQAAQSRMDTTPGLPRLYWSVDMQVRQGVVQLTGHAGAEYAEQDVRAVLDKWAKHFDVEFLVAEDRGLVEYWGRVGEMLVRLWGVVDRDAFEAVMVSGVSVGGEE